MAEPKPSKLATGVRFSSPAPVTFLFELFEHLLGSSIKKSSLKERMVFVVIKIITQELEIESNLKQRLEFICEFCHIKPTIINGSIRKIDKTNLSYIEPHKIIVKDTTFLAFNYSTDIYVGSLNKKIKLVELEDYIKNLLNA